MNDKDLLISCLTFGFLGFLFLLIWLINVFQRRSVPVYKLKYIDLKKGVILQLTNKLNTEYTLRSFHLHVLFPKLDGEAHALLLDYVMQPNEVVEIPMKIHAGKVPEVGTKVLYAATLNIVLRNYGVNTTSAGRVEVVSAAGDDMKHEGFKISACRSA